MKMISTLAGLSALLLTGAAQAAEKPAIVLVHGAFEDASIWRGVEARLHADGYKTIAVDLPGRPSNPRSPAKTSLTVYRDAVLAAIDKTKRPVILVGHSFGGIVISDVAEAAPAKVRTLVYLAALLPQNGDSLVSMSSKDKSAQIGPHIRFDKEHGLASIEDNARAAIFFNDAPLNVQAIAVKAIVDEPLPPLAEGVHVTAARFGRVDKTYIHTAQDHVVSPAAQAAMVAGTHVRLNITLNTGHTPFVTDVSGLVNAIEQSAK